MEPLTIVDFVLSLAALGASITAHRAISKVGKTGKPRPAQAGPYPAGSVPGVVSLSCTRRSKAAIVRTAAGSFCQGLPLRVQA